MRPSSTREENRRYVIAVMPMAWKWTSWSKLPNGKWGAFEAKLGDAKIPQAEKSLLRLREKVRANPAARNPDPLFLAVLAGVTPAARKLPSGVCVVPLTSLGA